MLLYYSVYFLLYYLITEKELINRLFYYNDFSVVGMRFSLYLVNLEMLP